MTTTKKPRTKRNIARNNKNIGREFQKQIAKLKLDTANDMIEHRNKHKDSYPAQELFTKDDCRSTPMAAPGEDIMVSSRLRKFFLMTQDECKSRKSLQVEDWMLQCENHGEHEPIVWSKKSGKNSQIYVTMKVEFYLKLIQIANNRMAGGRI